MPLKEIRNISALKKLLLVSHRQLPRNRKVMQGRSLPRAQRTLHVRRLSSEPTSQNRIREGKQKPDKLLRGRHQNGKSLRAFNHGKLR